nr:hypothetical protein [Arthrobacter alpinus]
MPLDVDSRRAGLYGYGNGIKAQRETNSGTGIAAHDGVIGKEKLGQSGLRHLNGPGHGAFTGWFMIAAPF